MVLQIKQNKEQWHEDPYAEKAAQVRAAYEANNP
jgi:hypothetical protein